MKAPALIVLCGLLFTANAVRAGEVVVVLSSDAAPYAQAENGLRSPLADKKIAVRSVGLKDVNEKGLDATVGKGADAVVAIGSPAAVFLHKNLPATTRLIYCMVADPAALGLTEGRVCWGVSTDIALAVQLALMAEAMPQGRTVGMLYRSDTPEGQRLLKKMGEALAKDWKLEAVAVDKAGSVAAAIEELTRRRIDVIWTAADASVYDTAAVRALLLSAIRANIPVYGFSPAFVRAGALMGKGVDPAAQGKQAAAIVAQVVTGGTADPPARVEMPDQSQIALNLIVAEKLGIRLPDGLVQRSTYVFRGDR